MGGLIFCFLSACETFIMILDGQSWVCRGRREEEGRIKC
jgi:hypothetical protein